MPSDATLPPVARRRRKRQRHVSLPTGHDD
jgi:hypothetical protein